MPYHDLYRFTVFDLLREEGFDTVVIDAILLAADNRGVIPAAIELFYGQKFITMRLFQCNWYGFRLRR